MLDFSKEEVVEYELIEEGTYECELTVEWRETKAQVPFINCVFKIRDDVDQKFQGRLVFDGIYKNKQTNEFHYGKIQSLLNAVSTQNYQFEDYDELIQFLNGSLVRVKVEIEEADENRPGSKTRNIIGFKSYEKTLHPTKKVVAPTVESVKEATTTTDVTDDDFEEIPF